MSIICILHYSLFFSNWLLRSCSENDTSPPPHLSMPTMPLSIHKRTLPWENFKIITVIGTMMLTHNRIITNLLQRFHSKGHAFVQGDYNFALETCATWVCKITETDLKEIICEHIPKIFKNWFNCSGCELSGLYNDFTTCVIITLTHVCMIACLSRVSRSLRVSPIFFCKSSMDSMHDEIIFHSLST